MDLAWILASLSRFWEMSVLWKKSFFCDFSCPHPKKIQAAANRTIFKIDAFHISHFEAYVPNFSKHLWKLAIHRQLWVPVHFKVGWSRTVSAKMDVFRPLFLRKYSLTNLTTWTLPSVIHGGWKATDLFVQMVLKERIFFTLWSVRFLMTLLDLRLRRN